jgi:hypothetical protein
MRARLLLTTGALCVAAVAVAGPSDAGSGGTPHRDYLEPRPPADQCDLPLAQRVGGWACPAP